MAPKKSNAGINPGGKSPAKGSGGKYSNVGGGNASNGGVKQAGTSQGRVKGKFSRGKK